MKKSIWLVSPPASGKTTVLLDIFTQLNDQNWVFLSPLRALAEEFYQRVKDIIPTQMYWKNRTQIEEITRLIILTPEQVDGNLDKFLNSSFVIIDEIHLWAHWGDSFRPTMWESYYYLAEKSDVFLHLTATANTALIEWVDHSQSHFDETIFLDYGNNLLKFWPDRIVYYPLALKARAINTIKRKLKNKNKGTKLVFCAFRNEVEYWMKWCLENNLFALKCVGGEAKAFQQELQLIPRNPDVIISTTVLSHGVNLPEISGVYFTYKVSDQDFWIQMVTRGGRRGQKYEVITFDKEFIKPSWFAIFMEELNTSIYSALEIEGPWNLKESLPQKSLTKNET